MLAAGSCCAVVHSRAKLPAQRGCAVADASGTDGWLYVDAKRPHTHDVRTLLTLTSEGEALLLLSVCTLPLLFRHPLLSTTAHLVSTLQGTGWKDSGSVRHSRHFFAGRHHVQSLTALVLVLQGGNDAQLLAHSCDAFMQHHPTRVCRIPQRPLTSIATAAGGSTVLLSAHGTDADLWRLPAVQQVLLPSQQRCNLLVNTLCSVQHQADGCSSLQGFDSSSAGTALAHLARIRNKSGAHLLAAAVSPDGARVAYSDAQQLRVFDITSQLAAARGDGSGAGSCEQRISVRRRPLPSDTPPAHQLCFAPDGRLLVSAADGRLSILNLDADPVSLASFGQPPNGGASAIVAGMGASRGSTARDQLQPAAAALATDAGGAWVAAAAGSQVGPLMV